MAQSAANPEEVWFEATSISARILVEQQSFFMIPHKYKHSTHIRLLAIKRECEVRRQFTISQSGLFLLPIRYSIVVAKDSMLEHEF